MKRFSVNYQSLTAKLKDDKPFGLLSQQTSPLGEMLHEKFSRGFKAVFSAEHGYFGLAAPGEKTSDARHPRWKIPVYSLYGNTRKPTPKMLKGLERIVIDLQDIGIRCYTYLASLKLVMEASAENGVEVIVLDRPVPLGGIVDGPMPDGEHMSFVCPADLPLCHGMTIGEEAQYMAKSIPNVKLSVVKMKGWSHDMQEPWPDFLPPSPGIKSWDAAVLYPVTVFTEAFPALDTDRGGNLAFRVLGAEWMDPQKLIKATEAKLREYGLAVREYRWGKIAGVLLSVESIKRYRPAAAGMTLLAAIRKLWPKQLAEGAREEWLAKLMGGVSYDPARWGQTLSRYRKLRVNLY
jgi:uncharacterized protein YbbC (DUF1343 family)